MNVLRALEIEPALDVEVYSDPELLQHQYSQYTSDESKFRGDLPLSLSFPKSLEELVAVMRGHYESNESTTISGTRSGVVGASVPVGKTHSVSLEKLTGIEKLYYDEKASEWIICVKAGTPLTDIHAYLQEHSPELYYPVDPTYQRAAIGGNVGTNASGMRTYHYGSTRNWVVGLTVVLVDGSVLKLRRGEIQAEDGELILDGLDGRRVLRAEPISVPKTKHSIGYHYYRNVDPIDIFIGSEGTLGVFAEVALRLALKPKKRLYFVQFFDSDEPAFEFAKRVQDLGLQLLAVEFFDAPSIAIAGTHPGRSRSRTLQMLNPELKGGVFLDVVLEHDEDLDRIAHLLGELVESLGGDPHNSLAGTDDKDLADFKVFRHAIPEMINATVAERKKNMPRLHKISTDMSVDPKYLEDLYRYYKLTFKEIGIDWFIFGHFGSGHLHVNVVPKTETQLDNFLEIYPSIGRKIVELGGAVAGEHGIGKLKKQFMPIQFSEGNLRSMRAVKTFFDPKWLLGRGTLLDC